MVHPLTIFRDRFLASLLTLVSIAGGASVLLAQSSRGTVTGIVTDPSKAAVANAVVDLTREQTKVVRSTRTNQTGSYVFDAVDPGSYSLKVTVTGFAAVV